VACYALYFSSPNIPSQSAALKLLAKLISNFTGNFLKKTFSSQRWQHKTLLVLVLAVVVVVGLEVCQLLRLFAPDRTLLLPIQGHIKKFLD
jgi:hypothetical protein